MARVLLIDDDDFLASLLMQALADAGHSVRVATNGFDGVALHRNELADVIVTDITMPHGGVSMIRALRAEFPDLPMIAMSGSDKHLAAAAVLGANGLLAKPFNIAQLTSAVADALAVVGKSP